MERRGISRSLIAMADVTRHTEAGQDKPWHHFHRVVFRLQKRIYQASQRGDSRTVHKLQRLLLASSAARHLAVRRVTQDNQGKRTAGIDGRASLKPHERLQLVQALKQLEGEAMPLRRTSIPKPGTTERRPLGIPICLAYCISLSNGFGNGRRLDPRRGSRRALSIGEWTSPEQAPTCP